jgi:hypothetical protein
MIGDADAARLRQRSGSNQPLPPPIFMTSGIT